MSSDFKTREDLIKLKEYIELIKTKWLTVDSMNTMVNGLLPKDSAGIPLVNSKIRKDGGQTGIYLPRYNTIQFSVEKCRQWVIDNLEDLSKMYDVKDQKTFGYYLTLFIMLHEVEHSYQYLMGQGKVDSPCDTLKGSFKTLTELLIKPNDILPRPIKQTRRAVSLILYYKNQNMYALERNANVEAFSTILALAYDSGHEEMIRVFTDLTNTSLCIGYQDDSKGVFYHTFKDILMLDKYKRINNKNDLNVDDKMRYGLEIPDYKRRELLNKIRRT